MNERADAKRASDIGIRSETSLHTSVAGVLTLVFLLLMPLVNVLGPSVWFAPPMLAASVLLAWLICSRKLTLDPIFLALMALMLWCFSAWIFSTTYISPKTAFHAIGLLTAVIAFYAGARCGMVGLLQQGKFPLAVKCVFIALTTTSLFIIVEFIALNKLHVNVAALVPYIEVQDFEAQSIGGMLRPRGFATEPGVMALFFDFSLFLVVPLLRTRMYRWIYFLIIIPGYLLLLSAASIAGCAIVLSIISLGRMWSRFASTVLRAILLGCLLGIPVYYAGAKISQAANESLVSKAVALSSGVGATSGEDRLQRYKESARVLERYPLGIGFGIAPGLAEVGHRYEGLTLSAGQVSLPGTFLIAGGIPAGVGIITVLVLAIRSARRSPIYGGPVVAGGLALCFHQLFVSEYWLPFFWFFLAVASALGSSRENWPRATAA